MKVPVMFRTLKMVYLLHIIILKVLALLAIAIASKFLILGSCISG